MKKVILLVDDDNDDYDVFREALEETGCEAQLFRVENGAAVFEYMADEQLPRPDIIFLDLNMPVMNGWQCLAKLKNTSGLENSLSLCTRHRRTSVMLKLPMISMPMA